MNVLHLLNTLFGAVSMFVGFVVLVQRIDPLQLRHFRFEYVAMYVLLGAGCMASGWMLVAGAAVVSFTQIALVAATVALLRMQRSSGRAWVPPESARSRPATLDEAR